MLTNDATNKDNQAIDRLIAVRTFTELEYIKILEEDFGMAQYYDIFDSSEGLREFTEQMLSNAVMLNKYIAPRLYDLCAEVQTRLGFEEQIDFYVQSTPELNAFSLNGCGLVPHIVCMNSALIQLASDDELRFVIGHEIGHIVFEHNKLDFIKRFILREGEERAPIQIYIAYLRSMHAAEISADRVGYLAMPDINIVTKAIFKLHFGLPAESMNFKIEEYLKQLDKLHELGVGNFYTSHPNPMIRIQALLDFEKSQLAPVRKRRAISPLLLDCQLKALLLMMEKHPKSEKDKNAVNFLSAVGMYLIYDQDNMNFKYNALYEVLIEYTTQPELYLFCQDQEQLQKKLTEGCTPYVGKAEDSIFRMLRQLVYVVLVDGRLDPMEKERLHDVARRLQLSEDTMNYIIAQVSEAHLNPNKYKQSTKAFF